jgi:hypothetical protein
MSLDTTTETAIFERIVLPREPSMTKQVARSLLALEFGQSDRQRLEELAEKARLGTLTADEQREAENYERVGHYLAILQSKARTALDKHTDSE